MKIRYSGVPPYLFRPSKGIQGFFQALPVSSQAPFRPAVQKEKGGERHVPQDFTLGKTHPIVAYETQSEISFSELLSN